MTYYERLRAVREDADMTQAELALILGTTRQQIGKYETGTQEMTVSKLAIICQTLEVSADYLLGLPPDLPWPR